MASSCRRDDSAFTRLHPEKQVFGRPACTSQFVIHEACPSTRTHRSHSFFLVQQISCQPARETHQIGLGILAGCLSGLHPGGSIRKEKHFYCAPSYHVSQGHPLTFSAVHDFHNAGVPVTMCSSRFPFSANSIEGFITFDGRAVRDGIGELHKIKKEGED